MAPSSENELCNSVATSLLINDRPSAFRYPRGEGIGEKINEKPEVWEIGKAKLIRGWQSLYFVSWDQIKRFIDRI